MGIHRAETLDHWNYFLAIEDDLSELARYVDLSGNDSTYSLEIARLFLSSCSEIDVVLRQVCKSLDADSDAEKINPYFQIISQNTRDFLSFEVLVPKFGIELHPFEDWTDNSPPLWWQDHNKVKHRRHQHFERATLKNCLNSVAALFVSLLYLYREQAAQGGLYTQPKLFNVGDQHFNGTSTGRFGTGVCYDFS